MAGYWNQSEETARTLVDGWLRTGDMARRASDGFLHFADRKKDIVITGGFNVWPKEVEDALLGHPDVAQAAVVGAPDEKWGEIVVAYVVARAGRAAVGRGTGRALTALLADYKKPRRIHFVDALPLTPVGKISRPPYASGLEALELARQIGGEPGYEHHREQCHDLGDHVGHDARAPCRRR